MFLGYGPFCGAGSSGQMKRLLGSSWLSRLTSPSLSDQALVSAVLLVLIGLGSSLTVLKPLELSMVAGLVESAC